MFKAQQSPVSADFADEEPRTKRCVLCARCGLMCAIARPGAAPRANTCVQQHCVRRLILVANHLPLRARADGHGGYDFEWDEDALIGQAKVRTPPPAQVQSHRSVDTAGAVLSARARQAALRLAAARSREHKVSCFKELPGPGSKHLPRWLGSDIARPSHRRHPSAPPCLCPGDDHCASVIGASHGTPTASPHTMPPRKIATLPSCRREWTPSSSTRSSTSAACPWTCPQKPRTCASFPCAGNPAMQPARPQRA